MFALTLPREMVGACENLLRLNVCHRLRGWAGAGLCLAVSLAPPAAAAASLSWRWSNPAPHGAALFDTACSGGLAVQVGERGQNLHQRGFRVPGFHATATPTPPARVTFLEGRIVMSGESGTILFWIIPPSSIWYRSALATGSKASPPRRISWWPWATTAQFIAAPTASPGPERPHRIGPGSGVASGTARLRRGRRGWVPHEQRVRRDWRQRSSGTTRHSIASSGPTAIIGSRGMTGRC